MPSFLNINWGKASGFRRCIVNRELNLRQKYDPIVCLYVMDMVMASSTKAIMRSVVPSVDWCLADDSLRAVLKSAWKAAQNFDLLHESAF
jgi:hypothetical protein